MTRTCNCILITHYILAKCTHLFTAVRQDVLKEQKMQSSFQPAILNANIEYPIEIIQPSYFFMTDKFSFGKELFDDLTMKCIICTYTYVRNRP